MEKTEKSICAYTSILISLLLSVAKLAALKNSLMSRFWRFDVWELVIQVFLLFTYCYFLFYVNLTPRAPLGRLRERKKYFFYVSLNLAVAFLGFLICGIMQYRLFGENHQIWRIFWMGCIIRSTMSIILVGIMVKIILLMREGRQISQENEQLRSANLEAQLELLKEQINPHFLFNSLTSLSAIAREDPAAVQIYIGHLSKVFRYALVKPGTVLVTLQEEIQVLRSFEQLLLLRLEDRFQLRMNLSPDIMACQLPHLSLQPLLENAAKHNVATTKNPLIVDIYNEGNVLVVSNNFQPYEIAEPGSGIGLLNLSERFRILMKSDISIITDIKSFIVKLPLKK